MTLTRSTMVAAAATAVTSSDETGVVSSTSSGTSGGDQTFWKHTEFARYLLERLLLVGPVQGRVVEAMHDGGFDDFEIGRDVEIARHVQR